MTQTNSIVYLFYLEGEHVEHFTWTKLFETGCVRYLNCSDATDPNKTKRYFILKHLEHEFDMRIDWHRFECSTYNELQLIRKIEDFLTVGRYRVRTRLYCYEYDLTEKTLSEKDVAYWQAIENGLKPPCEYESDESSEAD